MNDVLTQLSHVLTQLQNLLQSQPQVQAQPAAMRSFSDTLAPHIWVFYAAFLVSFVFTPVMRSIATYYGIIDAPDQVRKLHAAPVAYLGGVAVFMGWVAGLAMSQIHITFDDVHSPHFRVQISIVIGAFAIVALGLWDDLRHIAARYKVVGQVAAALLLLSQGVGTHCLEPMISPINGRLQHAFGPAVMIPENVITWGSILVVILMVVGCCNATNLLDGLDGLCGGVTAVIAAGFLFLAVKLATLGFDPALSAVRIVLALSLLGAVLGFVPYNFNPASIFMGDTGSMFLGYSCATLIVLLAQEQSKWFLAAMVMFALPVLDTALAFMRRWVNGRPLFSADRHHFHHQLVARGLSVRKTVLISYSLALVFCLLGGLIAYIRTRYAGALYLVIFGAIIVAAYKMGLVHERPRVVSYKPLSSGNASASTSVDTGATVVVEIPQPPLRPPLMPTPEGLRQ